MISRLNVPLEQPSYPLLPSTIYEWTSFLRVQGWRIEMILVEKKVV